MIPKPESNLNIAVGKRFKKSAVIKTKKRQSESGKPLIQNRISPSGSAIGPGGSLGGSKRCSTSHFGAPQKSQYSSGIASKESSKRQSIISSLSKRSP